MVHCNTASSLGYLLCYYTKLALVPVEEEGVLQMELIHSFLALKAQMVLSFLKEQAMLVVIANWC